ncbi:MAG: hypothetical protein WCT20_04855, partial [Candidatus Babeliales bacterium]
ERRLFMHKKKLTLDSLNPTGVDIQDVATIYQYLQQYIVPSGFKVAIEPGGVFNAISSLDFKFGQNVKYALGYDFYSQEAEKIVNLKHATISLDDLVVEKTEQDSVRQHKLYTELMFLKPFKRMDVSMGTGGDITVASTSNIGHDWTVYVKCASSF